MARVTGDFNSDVIRTFKGVLDFYYWRGIGVVRSWPRKPALPRNPAVQAAGADFRDNSRAISALPLSLQELTAEEVKDTAYTWKDAWTTTVYGHGLEWGLANHRPPQDPRNLSAMIVDLYASPTDATTTQNVNSAAYIFLASKTFWVPFATVPFTHFRVAGYGQSNAAGQTVQLAVGKDQAPATPAHNPGPDVTIPNSIGHFDSGWLSIDNIPATDERWILFLKGSNPTVDLTYSRLYVEFAIL